MLWLLLLGRLDGYSMRWRSGVWRVWVWGRSRRGRPPQSRSSVKVPLGTARGPRTRPGWSAEREGDRPLLRARRGIPLRSPTRTSRYGPVAPLSPPIANVVSTVLRPWPFRELPMPCLATDVVTGVASMTTSNAYPAPAWSSQPATSPGCRSGARSLSAGQQRVHKFRLLLTASSDLGSLAVSKHDLLTNWRIS